VSAGSPEGDQGGQRHRARAPEGLKNDAADPSRVGTLSAPPIYRGPKSEGGPTVDDGGHEWIDEWGGVVRVSGCPGDVPNPRIWLDVHDPADDGIGGQVVANVGLTPSAARQVAAHLLSLADEIDPRDLPNRWPVVSGFGGGFVEVDPYSHRSQCVNVALFGGPGGIHQHVISFDHAAQLADRIRRILGGVE